MLPHSRDGRHEVVPPKPLYVADAHHAQFATYTGEELAYVVFLIFGAYN